MASDPKKFYIVDAEGDGVKVRTARGRLSYPWLFTPNKDDKYSASHVYPKSTDFSGFEEAVDAAAEKFFGPDWRKKHPKLKRPLLLTAESPAMGADPEAFPKFIRSSTKANTGHPPPKVYNHDRDPVTDASEAYPGRWAILNITVKGYDRDGNKGVTCYVNGAQLLEHGDRFAGGGVSADDFEAVSLSEDASSVFTE